MVGQFPFSRIVALLHLTTCAVCTGRDRLIANDFIQVRKVVEHVYEKVLSTNSEAMGAGPPAAAPAPPAGAEAEDRTEGSTTLAEDRVELLCNEQVRRDRYGRGCGDAQRSVLVAWYNNGQGIVFSVLRAESMLRMVVGLWAEDGRE